MFTKNSFIELFVKLNIFKFVNNLFLTEFLKSMLLKSLEIDLHFFSNKQVLAFLKIKGK